MTRYPLTVGLGGVEVDLALAAIAQLPAFADAPATLMLDGQPLPHTAGWAAELAAAPGEASALWSPGGASRVDVAADGIVAMQIADAFATTDEAIAILARLPFAVASIGPAWPDDWAARRYPRYSFGDGHLLHGWACAFRGAGHDRLVSRRWLEHAGPWRLVRGPDDLSVVQFHELGIDPGVALAHAVPGHRRMGDSDEGGYLAEPYRYSASVEGLYIAETRTLEIVVAPGAVVAPSRMRDSCAMRREQRANPPSEKPIERVAYVFLAEVDARAHLHELWLRELECWVADGGPKRRLDADYLPAR